MKARLELGDVFAIPLDGSRAGIGQVVATYGQGAFYFAIFDLLVHPDAAEASIDEALTADLLFLAPSLDSRLPVPYLTVIGSRPVRPGLPLPAHREVDADNLVQVVDFSGRRRRPATDDEARRLQNRRFVAPLRLARALRATAGMEPWQEGYAELVPDEALSSDRLFGPDPEAGVLPAASPWSPRTPAPVGRAPQMLVSRAITPRSPRPAPSRRPTTGPFPVAPTTGALRAVPTRPTAAVPAGVPAGARATAPPTPVTAPTAVVAPAQADDGRSEVSVGAGPAASDAVAVPQVSGA
ncbi:MAG: hypothetical protein FWH11_12550 [Micrococcales bacterium]|nr:hypothetical protein [Micrococcales bacterium]